MIPHVPPVCDISESSLVFEFDLPVNVKLKPDTAFSQQLFRAVVNFQLIC